MLLPNARWPEVASTSTVWDAARRAGFEMLLVFVAFVLSRREEFEAHAQGSCPGTIGENAHLGTVVV